MSLSELQRRICRLLASRRVDIGESYIAGGLALNTALDGRRVSEDIDVFHDTVTALEVSVREDCALLSSSGLDVETRRRGAEFVEVRVQDEHGADVEIQWLRDSAYRFFPLMLHPELGLTLHPFDLATNKILALVGRVKIRDWIDTLLCHERIGSLGCLAWAACGKDPGYNPDWILAHASRTAHYSAPEYATLEFDGPAPSPATLSAAWRAALADAKRAVAVLPPREVGRAVLDADGKPFLGDADALERALTEGSLRFHEGRIGGAFPEVRARSTS